MMLKWSVRPRVHLHGNFKGREIGDQLSNSLTVSIIQYVVKAEGCIKIG